MAAKRSQGKPAIEHVKLLYQLQKYSNRVRLYVGCTCILSSTVIEKVLFSNLWNAIWRDCRPPIRILCSTCMLLVCFADGDPDAENEEIIAEIAMQLRKLGDYVDSTFSKGNDVFFDS